MFRTVGFLIGFSLASIGLLFLVDASSALRTRDAAWELIQSLDIPSLAGLVSSNRGTLASTVSSQNTAPLQTRTLDSEEPRVEPPDTSVVPPPEEGPRTERSAARQTQPAETTPVPAAPAPIQAMTSVQAPASVQAPVAVQEAHTSATATPIQTEQAPARHWYVFWSPFGTEYAANGFAERLTGLTGLDFTVIREGPGEYQVAFAYVDENERSAGLAMIETQTGLRLRTPNP